MNKNLVIVESPAKARTIGRYLGDEYEITASVGHIRDLPQSTIGVDVKNDFKPRYITMRGKNKVIKEIKKLAENAEQIYIATDPDREGEAIAWHIANILKIDPDSPCRVTFNEITEKTIKQAIKDPRSIDMDLVNAQQARRILDRLVGYELSPILWKKIKVGLSAGRVQSVATRMLVEREEEIEKFVPEEYWLLNVLLETNKKETFKARYHGFLNEKNKVSTRKLANKEETDQILADIKDQPFTVHEVKKGTRKRQPSAPFTTSTLQQEAARRINFSSRKTMSIAQQLYEGVDLPGLGPTALVTYIRTDSVRVSNDAIDQARKMIERDFGTDYLPKSPRTYKNKNAAQDAHEAIRPSHFSQPPEKIRDMLSYDQYRLYKLIWDRFIASQMVPAKINTLTVDTLCNEHLFRSRGEQIIFPGFLKIYEDIKSENKKDDDDLETNKNIPDLEKNESLKCIDQEALQKFTQPPARYTEASLIKAMEEYGIGRPSTYAPTISTILDRSYAEKDKRQLIPTELGRIVTNMLRDNFDQYINVKFTAKMEDGLDTVEAGDQDWVNLLHSFYPGFHEAIEAADENIKKLVIEPKYIDEACPECGGKLQIKDGRYGQFIACSNFPDCKYTRSIVQETDSHCPKCSSPVVGKKSRRGSIFYVCDKSKDPECDFISWDLPIDGKNCSTCGSYMVQKRFRGRLFEKCSNKDCPTNKKKSTSKSKSKKSTDNKNKNNKSHTN
ncbi:MAG: type I DNA topoisomerase [Fastidiosipilaceae bacterium]|jgi:DNA topoisomerase-1|nr:type I DNA topoisomerase [Clostridiaceae bacterium]